MSVTTSTSAPWRTRAAVGAAYAAQGYGYATVVTALPGFKVRTGIDDMTISLVLLLGCLLAAAGSVTAERIATRRSSGTALVAGLLAQAVGLALVTTATSVPPLFGAFAVFAVGLGLVDASINMQGVLLQRFAGRSIMSTLFACLTAAAIVASLAQAALANLGATTGAVVSLLVAAVVAAAIALSIRGSLIPRAAAEAAGTAARTVGGATARAARTPLPRAGIWLFGAMVAAAFVADSAVSSWSAVYLADGLDAPATVAPLGYAAYQGAVLVSRLAGDPLVRRFGRGRVVGATVLLAVAGLGLVALVPSPSTAIVGFALTGIGVGALVPQAFSAAGELAPDRLDEVIARINLFNYVGALLGAVVLGLLSEGPGLGPAFLIPALLLLPAVAVSPRFGGAPATGTAGAAGAAAGAVAPPTTPVSAATETPPTTPDAD
ncbi:MFS transporter [Cellulomonas shaoxiangyii]|uniref:MFS transporter n=1 Tax=Cellulomonas shaoxiangyii TaxID=2566013 RepID=A0A4P7SIR6_9CELL|nr:MFS transporter [Cellulomonas shaoxiangyii]QCB92363.1 MFS transporter [Cellulomonas shaoxiangyii]TGY86243.1 MFS transporter [Cellulomonas shaoxiangyii]